MTAGEDQSQPEEPFTMSEAISPSDAAIWAAWRKLSPKERLARSWKKRSKLRDPQAYHDAKLFPKP
jgi:hypothetical protein